MSVASFELPRHTGWAAGLAVLAVTALLISFGLVQQPGLLTGAVLGVIVLAIALSAPLALLLLMLTMGAIDLSFMTGGFKSLLPHMGGLDMNGIRLVGATAGLSVFVLTAQHARLAFSRPQFVAYFTFLVWAGATLASSLDPLEGLRLYLKLAYPLLTFMLVVSLCDNKRKLELVMAATLVAGALIIFVVTPLTTLAGQYRIDHFGFLRIRGPSGHENPFSFYLMAMLFIGFARLVYRRQARYLFFCLGAGLGIALTLTRITFLASIAGVLLIALLSAVAQQRYRAVGAALLVTAAFAIPALPFVLDRSLGFVPTPGELASLLTDPAALYQSINWQGRTTTFWPVVWTGFMAAPITGLGLGSSSSIIAQHFPTYAANVAHNEYLRLAADTGVVGVLLFATAMSVWLATMIRCARRSNAEGAEYASAAVAAIIGWAIIALTDNPFDSYMYFTQYVGLLVGAAVAAQARQPEDELAYTARQ